MIFEQILTDDLGCAAYVVGCQASGEAVVVDAPLHAEPVLAACARHDARLVGVLETHTHADHVSGHGVLAAATGAWIGVHPLGLAEYEHRPLDDGERITVGNIALDVLHTPGHRPEHCAFAVCDRTRADEPWLLLTGDSLFVGDTARPDLAVGGEEGAEELYRSLHERLAGLSDGVEVYPGHVAGSLCGRGMSARTSTTLGFERRFNPMLAPMSPLEFVRRATSELAAKPPTVHRCVELNRGPLRPFEPEVTLVAGVPSGTQLLDVRDGAAFAAGHAQGTLNVPVGASGFATRAGFVLDPEREVTLIADGGAQAARAGRLLAAVGFDRLRELGGGIETLRADGLATLRPMSLADVASQAERGTLQVLDVREADEQEVLAPGAVAIPYRLLIGADLGALDPARPVAVVCQTGTRTPLGASILAARGFRDVRPVLGDGMARWPRAA
jgi:glyoxylase-like metal-dependent hydrolase (beta-lactamase superfamily II)/rhodanese-related sulfurtransferase